MIHKRCGGQLVSHATKGNRWIIGRGTGYSDKPIRSQYNLPDALVRCEACQLIGIEIKT